MPAFPALENRLTDGAVELRLAKEWDIPDVLIAHQDDPALYRRLGLVRPPSGAELGRRSEAEPGERAAGRALRLTVVEPGQDTCRGQLEIHRIDWDQGEAEIGIWLAPQVRGRGLAPRALRLAAGWLFGACGLSKLVLRTELDNRPMIRAARAAGFTDEEQSQGCATLAITPGDL